MWNETRNQKKRHHRTESKAIPSHLVKKFLNKFNRTQIEAVDHKYGEETNQANQTAKTTKIARTTQTIKVANRHYKQPQQQQQPPPLK